jgi:CHAT domain-containing protein
MFRILLFCIVIISVCCCTAKKQKNAATKPVLLLQPDTSLPKDKGVWLLAAKKRLQNIAALPDSLATYVRLNNMLYDSVKKWKGEAAAGIYQDNIIALHKKIATDTSLKKILAKAYLWWHFDHYTESYSDTAVRRLEQFLILTRNENPVNPLTIFAYQQLGIQYNVLGDLKKCGFYHSQFASLAKEKNNVDSYASGVNNTSIALNEQGLYDSSIQLIKPVLNEKGVNPKRTASLYANLAAAETGNKDFKAGLASAQKSLQIVNLLSSKDINSTDLMELKYSLWWNIGDIQIQSQNYTAAETSLKNALAFLMAYNKGDLKSRESGKLYISLARLFEKNQKLNEALAYFQKALYCVTNVDSNIVTQLPRVEELYVENTIMDALDGKADVLQKLYSINKDTALLKQAVACYSLAFEVENKLTRGFSYDESLMRQTRESKLRSEKAIAACYQLSIITRLPQWAGQAFIFVEKSKAVVLQESIRRNIAAIGLLQNDSNWMHVKQAQQLVNLYEKNLAIIKPGDTTAMLFKAKLANAEQDLLFAKTFLLHGNHDYRDILLKSDSFSVDEIKNKLLNDNTTLVEFFSGDSATYIFSCSKKTALQFSLLAKDINDSLDKFLSFFTSKNKINDEPAAYKAAAFYLFKQSGLGSIQNKASGSMLIIPDGKFNLVPFEALVTDTSGNANPKSFTYLLKNTRVDYGYSAASLLKLQEVESIPASNSMVAVAPVFKKHERNLAPLLYTVAEIEAMQKIIPSASYLVNENATIGRFRNKIVNASVIHIASHASSGSVAGTPPFIEFYDSTLYLNEIYAMHIDAGLVVLSACETGTGLLNKSEGAMSLARGFYYAGTQNVITSLWSVDDRSTASIFGDFYQHLSGNDYSGSLHKAKLNYLKNATVINASPYYWAGFVHIGYEKQHPKNHLFLLILIACIGIVLFCVFFLYRHAK